MCGGGGDPAPAAPVDTYKGPPGPGMDIGNVPLGRPNYQEQAQSLLSIGQTYGQMASGIAGMLDAQRRQTEAQFMAPPPAPDSAFDSGIGQYIGQRAARPMGQSAPMAAIESFEAAYDPRTSAVQFLDSYQSGTEARPLSYYTPESLAAMEEADRLAEEEEEEARRQTAAARAPSSRGADAPGLGGSGGLSYRGAGDMMDGGGPQASTIGGRDFAGPNPDGSAGNDGPRGGIGGMLGGLF